MQKASRACDWLILIVTPVGLKPATLRTGI